MILKDIINRVEEKYNNKLPSKEVSSFELGKLIGQQEVVNFLKALEQQLLTPKKDK